MLTDVNEFNLDLGILRYNNTISDLEKYSIL